MLQNKQEILWPLELMAKSASLWNDSRNASSANTEDLEWKQTNECKTKECLVKGQLVQGH